mgnify:CR=1 FL=1
MDGTNEFVRTQCYKHLLKYTNEASIEIKGKYTFFDSLDGKRLKIKNSDKNRSPELTNIKKKPIGEIGTLENNFNTCIHKIHQLNH